MGCEGVALLLQRPSHRAPQGWQQRRGHPALLSDAGPDQTHILHESPLDIYICCASDDSYSLISMVFVLLLTRIYILVKCKFSIT